MTVLVTGAPVDSRAGRLMAPVVTRMEWAPVPNHMRNTHHPRHSRRTTIGSYVELFEEAKVEFLGAGELGVGFHAEVIAPLVGEVGYAAGLLGWGSDVLGYDTERSTYHGWGRSWRLGCRRSIRGSRSDSGGTVGSRDTM